MDDLYIKITIGVVILLLIVVLGVLNSNYWECVSNKPVFFVVDLQLAGSYRYGYISLNKPLESITMDENGDLPDDAIFASEFVIFGLTDRDRFTVMVDPKELKTRLVIFLDENNTAYVADLEGKGNYDEFLILPERDMTSIDTSNDIVSRKLSRMFQT